MPTSAIGNDFFAQQIQSRLGNLYGVALHMTHNHHDAEDLVAETVSKAWTSRDALEQPAAFRAWLLRILTNTFISRYRKTMNAPDTEPLALNDESEFSLFEKLDQPFPRWWSGPERDFLGKRIQQDIEKALDALPEASRSVVLLAYVDGFTYAEVARIVGIPIGTVRSRLARARCQLQRVLLEHAADFGIRGTGNLPGKARAAPRSIRGKALS